MAVAVKPAKNLLNIRSGIKSIKDSFSGLRKNAGNLNDVVLKKTKVKRESIARNTILSQRRKEDERRKAKEDLLEASTIGGAVKRQAKAVASSTKGFLGRIMDFLATLLVGWLLTNLPSIITMAQELIARIQRLYTIVTGFFDNTIKMFRGFGDLLSAVGKNILTFDFTDSKGRVEGALKDLGGTFEDMQKQFDEGFKLLTTSLGEGIVSGEDAAPFGTQYENESMQQQPSDPTGGGGKWKPLLDVIASGEGGYESVNPGQVVPGLTQMTIADAWATAQRVGRSKRGSGAMGRYQLLSDPIGRAKKAGLDPYKDNFSPANQDKIAIYIIENIRKGKQWLSGNLRGGDVSFAQGIADEWAGVPNLSGQYSYPGQGGKVKASSVRSALEQVKSSPTPVQATPIPIPSPSSARGITTAVRDEINVAGPSGGTPRVGLTPGQGFGASRRGGRRHEGIDIGTSGQRGYYVSFRSSGKVVFAGVAGGYGNTVDIVTSDGTCYRFAHLAKMMVRKGESYNGQTIGEIGNTGSGSGIHLHYEVRPGGPYGKAIDPRPYLGLLSIGRQLTGLAGQPTQIAAPTPAQITPSGTQQRQQVSQQLAQQQVGPSIVIIEEEPPASQSQGSIGGGGAMMIPIVINPLNSFITKKLLLDLAYT